MPTIRQSYLQRAYRPMAFVFLAVVLVVFGAALYAGSSRAVITISPLAREVSDTATVILGPGTDDTVDLEGTVIVEQKSASVTALPSSEGVEVPAQARGQVVLHNETAGSQALAVGTRLQAASGVIARTTSRVDVPARGTVEVEAVADPTGKEGELEPGRLTIVALRAANQAVIYGVVEKAFTGGLAKQTGALGVESLTTASNDAKELVQKEVGRSQPGRLVTLIPVNVVTDPKPEVPSEEYSVTVTLDVVTVTYNHDALVDLLQPGLTDKLSKDETLANMEAPTLVFEDQPRSSQARVKVSTAGQAILNASSSLIQPIVFVGRTPRDIRDSLLGTKLISDVKITLMPWWQRSMPKQLERIRVILQSPSS